jgi:hypothetical protein
MAIDAAEHFWDTVPTAILVVTTIRNMAQSEFKWRIKCNCYKERHDRQSEAVH